MKTGFSKGLGLGCLVLCAMAGAANAQVGEQYTLRQGSTRMLATRPQYPSGMVDDVRRPGFNGRLWIGRPIIGGVETGYPYGWGEPGPSAYGASEDSTDVAYVRIGNTAAAVYPFETVRGSGLKDLEAGRQQWLAERGYTGGVRTFVNDLYLYQTEVAQAEQSASAGEVAPRATITLPLDQPRFKARMHVRGEGTSGAAAIALLGDGSPLKISWPHTAPEGDASLIKVVTSDTAVADGQSTNDEKSGADRTRTTPAQPAATPVALADR